MVGDPPPNPTTGTGRPGDKWPLEVAGERFREATSPPLSAPPGPAEGGTGSGNRADGSGLRVSRFKTSPAHPSPVRGAGGGRGGARPHRNPFTLQRAERRGRMEEPGLASAPPRPAP